MGHRPFPNADRALRQIRRGRRTWIVPAADGQPWIVAPARVDVSTVRMPRLPDGWERTAGNIRSVFTALSPAAPADASAEQLRHEAVDQRQAHRTASAAADRFRDVLCEILGHQDENPGDDALVSELRELFGKTGPEPMNWRGRLAGYEALRDQINATARDGEAS